jgi:chromosome segregation ATPase
VPSEEESEEEKEVEDKKLYTGTFMGIADLRRKLADLAQAHEPCAETIQGLTHTVARRDQELATLAREKKEVEALLDELRATHAPCSATIADREREIARLDKLSKNLEQTVAARDEALAALTRSLQVGKRTLQSPEGDVHDPPKETC